LTGPPRYYIGLANTPHDPAIAIVGPDGDVRFAEASERYLQSKRAWNQPADLLVRVPELIERWAEPDAEFRIATSWSRPWFLFTLAQSVLSPLSLDRLLGARGDADTPMARFAFRLRWIYRRLFRGSLGAGENLQYQLRIKFGNRKVSFRHYRHHLTHAAYGCLASQLEDAVCMVVDAVGEFGNLSAFHYRDGRLEQINHCWRFASLGLVYTAVTEWCGFDPLQGEEWKVMGLAPYGRRDPEVRAHLEELAQVRDLDIRLGSWRGLRTALKAMEARKRLPEQPPLDAADIAFTGQEFFGDRMEELLHNLAGRGLSDNLVLTGGCALNSAFNGTALQRTPFETLHVPSAPGDDGNAIGAALLAWCDDHPGERLPRRHQSPYLGSTLDPRDLAQLREFGGLDRLQHLPDDLAKVVAGLLADGKLVGWVQGRAEFGPRALGNRSILADPRREDMKETVNARVKFREPYRPFAPSILDDRGDEWFEDYRCAPYMERTLVWRPEVRERVPAVVHADGTGRVQSVRAEWNPRFAELLEEFDALTGVPILLNTSLNVMGKPIVHSVRDAIALFFTSGLDALVLEDYLLLK
jgi:carbamoyltransferase